MWDINLNKSKKVELPDPIGCQRSLEDNQGVMRSQDLKAKAWAVATSGFSSIFMTLFMMYMSGSGMNIFTLLITFQFIRQPVGSLMQVEQVFSQFQGKGIILLPYKLVYLLIHLFIFSIGLYKLYTIGLLPLNSADWIDLVPNHHQKETIIAFNYN